MTYEAPEWHGEYLRRGSHGIRVVQIQQRLRNRGWNIGIDGEFGRATHNVVVMFQREKGLADDGIVGRSTWDAMYAYFKGLDDAPPPPPTPSDPPPAPDPGSGDQHPDPRGQCESWGFDGNIGANPIEEFQRAFAWYDLSIDGDAGPETAKAVQKVVNEGGKLSPHFSIGELACKHCGRIRANREQLRTLERAREAHGAVTIVSGYRCPAHNAAVGGASNSQHKYGVACDVRIQVTTAENAGAAGIGTCGNTCLHMDRRDAGENNTTGGRPGAPTYWSYC